MSELIAVIYAFLRSDDGPEIYDDNGNIPADGTLLEIAQSIAEAIVVAGWPRTGGAA